MLMPMKISDLAFKEFTLIEAKTQVSPQKGLRTVYEGPWPENTDSSYPKFMFQRANRDLKSYSDRTKKVTTKTLLITLLRTSGTGHSKARRSLLRPQMLSEDIFSILIAGGSWSVELIHSERFHLLVTRILDQPQRWTRNG